MVEKLLACACTGFVVGVLFVVTADGPRVGRAAFPGFNGDIVFYSERVEPRQIFHISSTGGEAVPLTSEGSNYSPTWSPDGTQITFISTRDGPGRNEVYVMNADGSAEIPLTELTVNEGASEPVWSADGSVIAFHRRTGGGQDIEIWTVPASGGTPTVLIDSAGFDASPRFSPDGTRMAYHHGGAGEGDTEIYVADLKDLNNPMPVTDNDIDDFVPDWSPDGSRLVYQCVNGGNEICAIDADGTNQERLTPGSLNYWDPAWSPDGQRIVFNDFVNPSALRTMNLNGGDIQLVTAMDDYEPDWQPLGEPPPHQVAWGDHNCSGSADPVDGLLNLRHDAGLPAETNDCPEMGEEVLVNGIQRLWGDFDCSGAADPVDGLKILRFDAGLDVARPPSCPDPGETVMVDG